ncbi:MAG: hypothetical protein WBI55_07200, partial [Eubacteriales bacterium]
YLTYLTYPLYTLFLLYSITSSPKNNKIHQFGGLCLQSEVELKSSTFYLRQRCIHSCAKKPSGYDSVFAVLYFAEFNYAGVFLFLYEHHL